MDQSHPQRRSEWRRLRLDLARSSGRNEQKQFQYNADHTYRLFFDKEIDELPELAAENR
jgi:hypothetical protein